MTAESFAALRARRRRRRMPGLGPLVLGTLVWGGWILATDPVGLIAAALRQGNAAGYEVVFLAVVSVVGLVGLAMYAVAVTAYVLALRSLPRPM